jgi:hypothetical protein
VKNLRKKLYPNALNMLTSLTKNPLKKLKEELNEKNITGFEDAKRPLLIDFFIPNFVRKNILMKYQQFNPNARQ